MDNYKSLEHEAKIYSSGYIPTGNDIPINLYELEEYIEQKLDEYDKNENLPTNPYKDPLVYKTSDGRTVEIPKNIKNDFIKKRKREKFNNSSNIVKTDNNDSNKIIYRKSKNTQSPKYIDPINQTNNYNTPEYFQTQNNTNPLSCNNTSQHSNAPQHNALSCSNNTQNTNIYNNKEKIYNNDGDYEDDDDDEDDDQDIIEYPVRYIGREIYRERDNIGNNMIKIIIFCTVIYGMYYYYQKYKKNM